MQALDLSDSRVIRPPGMFEHTLVQKTNCGIFAVNPEGPDRSEYSICCLLGGIHWCPLPGRSQPIAPARIKVIMDASSDRMGAVLSIFSGSQHVEIHVTIRIVSGQRFRAVSIQHIHLPVQGIIHVRCDAAQAVGGGHLVSVGVEAVKSGQRGRRAPGVGCLPAKP